MHIAQFWCLTELHLITPNLSLVHWCLQREVAGKAGQHLCQNNPCSCAPESSSRLPGHVAQTVHIHVCGVPGALAHKV